VLPGFPEHFPGQVQDEKKAKKQVYFTSHKKLNGKQTVLRNLAFKNASWQHCSSSSSLTKPKFSYAKDKIILK